MLTHLPGKFNPADILSKHWGYQTIWPILKPILFFHGDTADLIQDDNTVEIFLIQELFVKIYVHQLPW
jgi:hypothetical protein